MDRLTLDTNALRDWAWASGLTNDERYADNTDAVREGKARAFNKLTGFRDAGSCELGVAPQFVYDFADHPSGRLIQDLNNLIGTHLCLAVPSLTTYPIVYTGYYFDRKTHAAIFRLVFPQSQPEHRRYSSNQRDALLLYAHLVSARDCFITSDTAILSAAHSLRQTHRIDVLEIDDYLSSY